MTLEDIVSGLRALKADDFADGMPDALYELTDAVKALQSPEAAIPDLFLLMERLYDCDLGSPGPIVHTLESLDYESELVASIRRRPTALTVWMVNRSLNSSLPPERRQFYLDLFAHVLKHPDADDVARDLANDFIEFQKTRSV